MIARSCGFQTSFADVQHVVCQRCYKVAHIALQTSGNMADGLRIEQYAGPCESCGQLLSMKVTLGESESP